MTVEAVKNNLIKGSFPSLLEQQKQQVANALPKHLRDNADRYARLALTAFRTNPKLAECNPLSVFAGVILASQLGLELNVLGQAYLVPFGNEAQFIPGWKGYVDLVHRSGRAICWTGCVFKGDKFEYQLGDNPFVRHVPMGNDDETEITHAYAIGHVKGIEWPIVEVWPVEKISRHRDRINRVGQKHYSYKNWEMYCRKVPLLQAIKYLPASVELSTLVAMDTHANMGQSQNLTIDAVAEGLVFPGSVTSTEATETEGTETATKKEDKQPETKTTETKTETKTQEPKAAEKKQEKKKETEKPAPAKEPEAEETKVPETVEEIAQQAAATVENESTKELADDLEDEQPATQDWEPGKEYRGVTFPKQLTKADGFAEHSDEQMETAKAESQRVGINLKSFVTKRLGVDVEELNSIAMGQLIVLLKGVSG